jgi:hippurate hydrolase
MVAEAAVELFGEDILHDQEPVMPAEDFSKYLVRCPGAFFFVGNGKGEHRAEGHGEGPCALHNASYDFNDESLEKGASIFARIVEKYMA